MTKTMLRTALLAATAWIVAAPAADAALYTFSFSNTSGGTSGTVAGTITLPDGDGTFAASSVIVTSAPAAISYAIGFDFVSGGSFPPNNNSFTVSAGNVTLAGTTFFGLFNGGTALSLVQGLVNGNTFSFLDLLNAGNFGATGVQDIGNGTLSFAPAAVPAPASLSLLGVGLLGLFFARRARG